jgi:SAM-dependent methyltransferase
MGMNTKSYFDSHGHHDAYHMDPNFCSELAHYMINDMKKRTTDLHEGIRILDIGCGDGVFIKSMINNGLKADFMGLDLSSAMIAMAKKNISDLNDYNIELFIADAFNLPLKSNLKFNVILIDSVLHHLIGKTRSKSVDLATKMIGSLMDRLSEKGLLIVGEVYYNSYFISPLTSLLIFYSLKLLNLLHLDLHHILKEVQLGLEVSFLYEKELQKLLECYSGNVYVIKKYPIAVSKLRRFLFLKECGYILFVAYKN